MFKIVFQGDGTFCTKDRTSELVENSGDLFGPSYPSYNRYTTTSERPWLRPPLTTLGPPVASGQYQCRREEDCHENASCVYQRQTRRYRCQCDKWYEGDGWETCAPGQHHVYPV